MNIWDYNKDIIRFKSGVLTEDPDFRSTWSSFMVARYVSMKDCRKGRTKQQAIEEYVDVACKINRFQCTLSSEQMYKYATAAIPQDNNTYIKYITKPKPPTKKKKNAKSSK